MAQKRTGNSWQDQLNKTANKCDLYDDEQVSEDEARNFASDIGAVFKLTSANTNIGIDELFKGLGCRVFDPNYSDDSDVQEIEAN